MLLINRLFLHETVSTTICLYLFIQISRKQSFLLFKISTPYIQTLKSLSMFIHLFDSKSLSIGIGKFSDRLFSPTCILRYSFRLIVLLSSFLLLETFLALGWESYPFRFSEFLSGLLLSFVSLTSDQSFCY